MKQGWSNNPTSEGAVIRASTKTSNRDDEIVLDYHQKIRLTGWKCNYGVEQVHSRRSTFPTRWIRASIFNITAKHTFLSKDHLAIRFHHSCLTERTDWICIVTIFFKNSLFS